MPPSPSSSSSESSSHSKSASGLSNFDPFAVHPFTNCSQVNQSSSPPYNAATSSYGYAYAANVSSQSRNPPQLPSKSSNNGAPNGSSRVPPATPNGNVQQSGGIFVPFRKDTSSPDLDDVLKSRKSTPSKPITMSSTRKY